MACGDSTPELSPEVHRAWSTLFVAQALLLKRIDAILAEAGVISLEVYDVLLTLEMADNQRLRMSELADRVLLSRSGLSRLIDRLEADKLIRRTNCPSDRRAINAELTEQGLAARERAWPFFAEAIQTHFGAHLRAGESQELTRIFGNLAVAQGRSEILGPTCAGK